MLLIPSLFLNKLPHLVTRLFSEVSRVGYGAFLIIAFATTFTSSEVFADRIIHKPSGKCVHPKGRPNQPRNNTALVIHSEDCAAADSRLSFEWFGDYIKHSGSEKCIHPYGGKSNPANNTILVLHDGCTENRVKFRQLSSGHIQHINSNKCIRTARGLSAPLNDTPLVLNDNCYGDNTKFSIKPKERLNVGNFNTKLWLPLAGKCIHPKGGGRGAVKRGTQLVVHSDDCGKNDDSAYRLLFGLENNSIKHKWSALCLVPSGHGTTSIRNNTPLILDADCASPTAKFKHLTSGSLQHIPSGKCIHPKGGSQNPRNDTQLVLYDTCDSLAIKFQFK